MPHKADNTFFDHKKEWSKRKDRFLDYYLKPYLDTVPRIGKPITIIDCFAGAGTFLDGSDGSPRIIAKRISEKLSTNPSLSIKLVAIEKDSMLVGRLKKSLAEFSFAETIHSTFEDSHALVNKYASKSTTFLYIDPFAVEGLDWATIESALGHIEYSKSSIEVLLNFNSNAFMRCAASALGQSIPDLTFDSDVDKTEHHVDWKRVTEVQPNSTLLDKALGGKWWQNVVSESVDADTRRKNLTIEFCRRLKKRCRYVCTHEIKEKPNHKVAKYVLVFASRHSKALLYINDAAVRSRDAFIEKHMPGGQLLFESRPLEWVPEPTHVRQIVRSILNESDGAITRSTVVIKVIDRLFGVYDEKTIKSQINAMFADGQIISKPGLKRLNDNAAIKLP